MSNFLDNLLVEVPHHEKQRIAELQLCREKITQAATMLYEAVDELKSDEPQTAGAIIENVIELLEV